MRTHDRKTHAIVNNVQQLREEVRDQEEPGRRGIYYNIIPLDHGAVGACVLRGATKPLDVVNQTEDKSNRNETCVQMRFTPPFTASEVDMIDLHVHVVPEPANTERAQRKNE